MADLPVELAADQGDAVVAPDSAHILAGDEAAGRAGAEVGIPRIRRIVELGPGTSGHDQRGGSSGIAAVAGPQVAGEILGRRGEHRNAAGRVVFSLRTASLIVAMLVV